MKQTGCQKTDISRSVTIALRNMCVLILCLALVGCASMAAFDSYSYSQTKALKTEALQLMDLATDSFRLHVSKVDHLKNKLETSRQYEKSRRKNSITVQQWNVLLNPDGYLLGGFLKEWEESVTLNKTVITEEAKIIGDAFDQITELEAHKRKSPYIVK